MKRIISSRSFFLFLLLAFSFLTLLSACKKDEINPVSEEEGNSSTIHLLPTIGPTNLPAETDSICPIPVYLGNDFEINAIPIGNQVPDFTLFDRSGAEHHLASILADEKPVFLMTGSLTCPVFRSKISELNNLITAYEESVNFLLMYTVEAHPAIDVSPYSGTVWTTNTNISNGILYEQPKTYGERLQMIDVLNANATINCDILVDGPCNDFWLNYGEAPNRAYLIDATGKVVISHGWFDYPSMVTSLNDFLGL